MMTRPTTLTFTLSGGLLASAAALALYAGAVSAQQPRADDALDMLVHEPPTRIFICGG